LFFFFCFLFKLITLNCDSHEGESSSQTNVSGLNSQLLNSFSENDKYLNINISDKASTKVGINITFLKILSIFFKSSFCSSSSFFLNSEKKKKKKKKKKYIYIYIYI